MPKRKICSSVTFLRMVFAPSVRSLDYFVDSAFTTNVFQDALPSTTRTMWYGWVPAGEPNADTDNATSWTSEDLVRRLPSGMLHAVLRVDSVKPPHNIKALVNKEIERALKTQPKLTRAEKDAIREGVTDSCLKKAVPKQELIDVVINPMISRVYVFGTKKQANIVRAVLMPYMACDECTIDRRITWAKGLHDAKIVFANASAGDHTQLCEDAAGDCHIDTSGLRVEMQRSFLRWCMWRSYDITDAMDKGVRDSVGAAPANKGVYLLRVVSRMSFLNGDGRVSMAADSPASTAPVVSGLVDGGDVQKLTLSVRTNDDVPVSTTPFDVVLSMDTAGNVTSVRFPPGRFLGLTQSEVVDEHMSAVAQLDACLDQLAVDFADDYAVIDTLLAKLDEAMLAMLVAYTKSLTSVASGARS